MNDHTPTIIKPPRTLAQNLARVAEQAGYRCEPDLPDDDGSPRWRVLHQDGEAWLLGASSTEVLESCADVERCYECGSVELVGREDDDNGQGLVVCLHCHTVDEAEPVDVGLAEVMEVLERVAAKTPSWPPREDAIRARLLRCGWLVGDVVTLSRAGWSALAAWREVQSERENAETCEAEAAGPWYNECDRCGDRAVEDGTCRSCGASECTKCGQQCLGGGVCAECEVTGG